MKKTAYLIIIAAMMLASTGCNRGDEKFDSLKQYLSTQSEVGAYKDGSPVCVFDKTKDQFYLNTKDFIFRIQNDDSSSYMELTLSAAPTLNGAVDVILKSEGHDGLASAAVYPGMTVTELKEGICRLTGGERASYAGFIIVWMTE